MELDVLPVRATRPAAACALAATACAVALGCVRTSPPPSAGAPGDAPAPAALEPAPTAPAPGATGAQEPAPPAPLATGTHAGSEGGVAAPQPLAAPETRAGGGSGEGTTTEAPPLPTGTTVLHIGDSFAGALGIDLNRELKAAGVRGVLKYQTATYIPTWASGKDLELHLLRYRPDLVLITLGANELEIPEPEQRRKTIQRLVGRLGDVPCVWVGPPLWKGARPALLETIRSSCAPCVYLDSTALVGDLPRTRDHVHPSMDGRRTWALAVLDWLRAHRDPTGARPWSIRP